MHMLEVSLARKLIEQLSEYTDYNVNIMDQNGIIIASRDPARVGTYHEPAWQILHGTEDIIAVRSDQDHPGVSRGVNMVIDIDGRREGVVGVTGDPEAIRPIALIIKMSIETMIRYEEQKLRSLRRQTKKELLQELVISGENADPAKLRGLTHDLGYRPDIPRIAILCRTEISKRDRLINAAKESPLHSGEDILFLPDAEHLLIFKSVNASSREGPCSGPAPGQYRAEILEYLNDISSGCSASSQNASSSDERCRFYIGTLQESLSCFHASYLHCRWLEEHAVSPAEDVTWFYDHTGEYLTQRVPYRELHQIFNSYVKFLSADDRSHFMELADSLIACGFSISAAAKKTYMHKNTFTYQYNKLRELLGINPQSDPKDRWLVIFLYLYLSRSGKESPDR